MKKPRSGTIVVKVGKKVLISETFGEMNYSYSREKALKFTRVGNEIVREDNGFREINITGYQKKRLDKVKNKLYNLAYKE